MSKCVHVQPAFNKSEKKSDSAQASLGQDAGDAALAAVLICSHARDVQGMSLHGVRELFLAKTNWQAVGARGAD